MTGIEFKGVKSLLAQFEQIAQKQASEKTRLDAKNTRAQHSKASSSKKKYESPGPPSNLSSPSASGFKDSQTHARRAASSSYTRSSHVRQPSEEKKRSLVESLLGSTEFEQSPLRKHSRSLASSQTSLHTSKKESMLSLDNIIFTPSKIIDSTTTTPQEPLKNAAAAGSPVEYIRQRMVLNEQRILQGKLQIETTARAASKTSSINSIISRIQSNIPRSAGTPTILSAGLIEPKTPMSVSPSSASIDLSTIQKNLGDILNRIDTFKSLGRPLNAAGSRDLDFGGRSGTSRSLPTSPVRTTSILAKEFDAFSTNSHTKEESLPELPILDAIVIQKDLKMHESAVPLPQVVDHSLSVSIIQEMQDEDTVSPSKDTRPDSERPANMNQKPRRRTRGSSAARITPSTSLEVRNEKVAVAHKIFKKEEREISQRSRSSSTASAKSRSNSAAKSPTVPAPVKDIVEKVHSQSAVEETAPMYQPEAQDAIRATSPLMSRFIRPLGPNKRRRPTIGSRQSSTTSFSQLVLDLGNSGEPDEVIDVTTPKAEDSSESKIVPEAIEVTESFEVKTERLRESQTGLSVTITANSCQADGYGIQFSALGSSVENSDEILYTKETYFDDIESRSPSRAAAKVDALMKLAKEMAEQEDPNHDCQEKQAANTKVEVMSLPVQAGNVVKNDESVENQNSIEMENVRPILQVPIEHSVGKSQTIHFIQTIAPITNLIKNDEPQKQTEKGSSSKDSTNKDEVEVPGRKDLKNRLSALLAKGPTMPLRPPTLPDPEPVLEKENEEPTEEVEEKKEEGCPSNEGNSTSSVQRLKNSNFASKMMAGFMKNTVRIGGQTSLKRSELGGENSPFVQKDAGQSKKSKPADEAPKNELLPEVHKAKDNVPEKKKFSRPLMSKKSRSSSTARNRPGPEVIDVNMDIDL